MFRTNFIVDIFIIERNQSRLLSDCWNFKQIILNIEDRNSSEILVYKNKSFNLSLDKSKMHI